MMTLVLYSVLYSIVILLYTIHYQLVSISCCELLNLFQFILKASESWLEVSLSGSNLNVYVTRYSLHTRTDWQLVAKTFLKGV